MLANLKKSLIVLAILLVTPIVLVIINWQWQPQSLNNTSEYLFWITETAGVPWALLSCVFFTLVFAFCLKTKSKLQMIKLLFILGLAILSGQLIKSVVKNYTAESRPFVLWMEEHYNVDDEYFYSLPRAERQDIIKQYVHNSLQIPNWLYEHWRNETGYTFPSGHVLFSATWAFLALLLLNFKRYHLITYAIIAWVILIEISRIALGMHRPVDVVFGSMLAWCIAWLCYYLSLKWKLIKKS